MGNASTAQVFRAVGDAKGEPPPAAAADSPTAAARSSFALILAVAFLVSLILPIDIHLGSLRFMPYRIVALVALIPCTVLVISGRAGALYKADILMMAHVGLAVLALLINHGFDHIEFAGMYVIETLGPYMLARCAVRSAADFRLIVWLALAMVVFMLPFTLYEADTGHRVLRNVFGHSLEGARIDKRLGLDRAFGPFEHPILYGNFVASCLAITVYSLGRWGSRLIPSLAAAVVGAATFVSLSSGPLGTFMFQIYLMIWDKSTRGIRNRWGVLFALFVAAYIAIDILSNRNPFVVLSDYLTFSAETAYSRVLIYEFGTAEVWRHPLFGIGLNEWQRPDFKSDSFDAFWLLQTMRYGIPAGLCLIGAVFVLCFALGRRALPPEVARYRKGWMISIVGLAVSGISVHFWGAVYGWLMFLLGSSAWMLVWPQQQAASTTTAAVTGAPMRKTQEQGSVAAPPAAALAADRRAPLGSATFCKPEATRWVDGGD
ncbi:MAG: hypothetical protein MUE49_12130 [Rhodospirillales bacterium]|nr:hypothetical protein [Rhodospirillales bacterium]